MSLYHYHPHLDPSQQKLHLGHNKQVEHGIHRMHERMRLVMENGGNRSEELVPLIMLTATLFLC